MPDTPKEVIAGLVRMVRNTRAATGALTLTLSTHRAQHTTISPSLHQQARKLSLKLQEAMSLNATVFEASPSDRERHLRSALDTAFREQRKVLKEMHRMLRK